MTDFIREKPGNDIFEGTLQEIVEITLKFKEEFSSVMSTIV